MTITTSGVDLREQREIADLDIQEVAELTGLPTAFIELLESGKHNAASYIYRVSKAIEQHRRSHGSTDDQR